MTRQTFSTVLLVAGLLAISIPMASVAGQPPALPNSELRLCARALCDHQRNGCVPPPVVDKLKSTKGGSSAKTVKSSETVQTVESPFECAYNTYMDCTNPSIVERPANVVNLNTTPAPSNPTK